MKILVSAVGEVEHLVLALVVGEVEEHLVLALVVGEVEHLVLALVVGEVEEHLVLALVVGEVEAHLVLEEVVGEVEAHLVLEEVVGEVGHLATTTQNPDTITIIIHTILTIIIHIITRIITKIIILIMKMKMSVFAQKPHMIIKTSKRFVPMEFVVFVFHAHCARHATTNLSAKIR
jgi:hypothetical protein